jgi:preprotein translocase subunit SecA
LIVYKTEGFKLFQALLDHIQHDVVRTIFRVQPVVAQQPVRTRLTEEAAKPSPVAVGAGNGAGHYGKSRQERRREAKLALKAQKAQARSQ